MGQIESYRERFEKLAKLEPGWDHPDDKAVDPECIELAKKVFDAIVSVGAEEPHPTPTRYGGVALTWHDDEGWLLEIEMNPGDECRIGAVYCPDIK